MPDALALSAPTSQPLGPPPGTPSRPHRPPTDLTASISRNQAPVLLRTPQPALRKSPILQYATTRDDPRTHHLLTFQTADGSRSQLARITKMAPNLQGRINLYHANKNQNLINKYNIFAYENNVSRESEVIGAHRMTSTYGEAFGLAAGPVMDKDGVPKRWDPIRQRQQGSQELPPLLTEPTNPPVYFQPRPQTLKFRELQLALDRRATHKEQLDRKRKDIAKVMSALNREIFF